MPTFKVTLIVNNGLSLGSILMTKDVELLHITEVLRRIDIAEKKYVNDKLLIEAKKIKQPRRHFSHPSGKIIKQFVAEHLLQKPGNKDRWININKYIISLGFGKSSLNNSLKHMISEKKIKSEGKGWYKLLS
jgi:hypothetical protein